MIPRPKRKTAYAKWKAVDKRENQAYLEWIHTCPCCICGTQYCVEGAHVGDRGYGIRCSNRLVLPICAVDHRISRTSQHVLGKRFFAFHGKDRDELLRQHHEMFDRLQVAAA